MQAAWPLVKSDEITSAHYEDLRKLLWLAEHPYAGNVDICEYYGKWVGDASHWEYVEYTPENWHWVSDEDYHPGFPVVLYRWGPDEYDVDIFLFVGQCNDTMLNNNPPVVAGVLNHAFWRLGVNPNKYAHWNKNAGRPDLGTHADARWILRQHGYEEFPGEGWLYAMWEAWKELPTHTDKFEQVPYIKTDDITPPKARYRPVEWDRDQITINLATEFPRTFTDGLVGTTVWVDADTTSKVSEYVPVNGVPVGNTYVGPDYTDNKKNCAIQDRILQAIEHNVQFVTPVNDFWIDRWQWWTIFGKEILVDQDGGCVNGVYDYVSDYEGTFQTGENYYKGCVVDHQGYYYRCLQTLYNATDYYSPTGEGGAGIYWSVTGEPVYQPVYIRTDPIYVMFNDLLFCCNTSAYERVLQIIDEMAEDGEVRYDWYFDDSESGHPAKDWATYQYYTYYLTLHAGDPDVGWAALGLQRYPPPRGCWRKVWRCTQQWDGTRDAGQEARFGKIIDIDGEKVSMMWPGELGYPPGYCDGTQNSQLYYVGNEGGFNHNYWVYKYLVTQEIFDNMERPVGDEDKYTKYCTVIDVENLFRDAYRVSGRVERHIAERHDPIAIDWRLVDGNFVKYPIFEAPHTILNDAREALSQLRAYTQEVDVDFDWNMSSADSAWFDTSLAAYRSGKNQCDALNDLVESSLFANVGYYGSVRYSDGYGYNPLGTVSHDWQTSKMWIVVEITKWDLSVVFPTKEVGYVVLDILAKNPVTNCQVNDTCTIGVSGVFFYTPPWDDLWHRAFVGNATVNCEWVHTGTGGDPDNWKLVCSIKIEHHTSEEQGQWPPEDYFTFIGNGITGRDWLRGTRVDIDTGYDKKIAIELDYNGFEAEVFEQDPTNFIEV